MDTLLVYPLPDSTVMVCPNKVLLGKLIVFI